MDDKECAERYLKKIEYATSREVEFTLTFAEFKKLMARKKCAYTGISLTFKRPGMNSLATDKEIDRIDNSKGYIKGNVVTVSHCANKLKSRFENPTSQISFKEMKMFCKSMEKLGLC